MMQSNDNAELLTKQWLDINYFYNKFKISQEEKLELGYGENPPIFILLDIFENNVNRENELVSIRTNENIIQKICIGMDQIAHAIKNDILKNNGMEKEDIKFDSVKISKIDN